MVYILGLMPTSYEKHLPMVKGCDALWMPENDDVLGSGSDLAEGNGEVWHTKKEGALGISRAGHFHLLA